MVTIHYYLTISQFTLGKYIRTYRLVDFQTYLGHMSLLLFYTLKLLE
jgi:hypothetical protein